MQLSELLLYHDIVIQCHNYPDADSIASGYGLYLYYASHGVKVRLIYAGKEEIKKSNLKIMIEQLQIPIAYVTQMEQPPELLITVDSQYGEGNIDEIKALKVAIIDHHQDCNHEVNYKEIRDTYGSCATVVYMMLLEEGYPVQEDERLMTALYYGLYMDTNAFSELKHPYDMDLVEELMPDEKLIIQLKNSNFTFKEIEIAAGALNRYEYNAPMRFAIVKANPCDPNLLGFISDLVLQVEGVDTCIAYCEQDYVIRFSVRNCNYETTAREIVLYLLQDMGTGGGHKNKAGGYLIRKKYNENYVGMSMLVYLYNSMKEYFTSYDIIDLTNQNVDLEQMDLYERIPVLFGVCNSTALAKEGEKVKIRTINGDIEIRVDSDLYLLMNMRGEIFQVNAERYKQNYRMITDEYECKPEYKPHVRRMGESQAIHLVDYLQCCISIHKLRVYAKRLLKTTKLYRNCDDKDYMLGEIGDYMVVKEEDLEASIIKRSQFMDYYKRVKAENQTHK